MDIGTALGRELGLPENKIAAVADWRATRALDDVEKLVLELAEALTATPVTVGNSVTFTATVSGSNPTGRVGVKGGGSTPRGWAPGALSPATGGVAPPARIRPPRGTTMFPDSAL